MSYSKAFSPLAFFSRWACSQSQELNLLWLQSSKFHTALIPHVWAKPCAHERDSESSDSCLSLFRVIRTILRTNHESLFPAQLHATPNPGHGEQDKILRLDFSDPHLLFGHELGKSSRKKFPLFLCMQFILCVIKLSFCIFTRPCGSHRHPVKLARLSASLPATLEYASQEKRQALAVLGKNFGCHTCGTRAPATYIADHMPPLKTVKLVSFVDGGDCRILFFASCFGL